MTSRLWLESSQKGEIMKLKSMRNTLRYLDINCVTSLNQSALMLAISGGHTATVKYLLQIGCDLNIEDLYGENALSLALRSKNRETIRTLYEKGCTLTETAVSDPTLQFELQMLNTLSAWKRTRILYISHRFFHFSLK